MNFDKCTYGVPGADLVRQGLADLAQDRMTESSFLVLIASPRLRRLGIEIHEKPWPRPYEHHLYTMIEERLGAAAHSYYNSLIRRIVSYAHALERERNDPANMKPQRP